MKKIDNQVQRSLGLKFHIDRIKYLGVDFIQRKCMKQLAYIFFVAAKIFPNRLSKLKLLLKSHRTFPLQDCERLILENLEYIQTNASLLFDGRDSASEKIQRGRAIVLKNPIFDHDSNCIEKGIFLIKFTGTFQFYIENIDINKLQKFFYIILEPSWAGYCLSEILWWSQFSDAVFVEASEERDYSFLRRVHKNLIPLSFGSSDWVNPDIFSDEGNSLVKDIDFIYVSNHSKGKRNYSLFKALNQLSDVDYKAAIVCSSWGEDRDFTLSAIKYFNLQDRIQLLENLSQGELNAVLNRSKVNMLLSLKEGSNRSIFEGFFANVPAIVLKENIGVNKTYVNSDTGKLISESELAETLMWFRANWTTFSARKWAQSNISIFKTKEKLDSAISTYTKHKGLNFSQGSALKVNSPEANFYSPNDKRRALQIELVLELFNKTAANSNQAISAALAQECLRLAS